MEPITAQLANTIRNVFGQSGSEWLQRLPDVLARYSAKWGLQVGPAFPNLTYNYVAPATRTDGAAVVLKLGVPNPELTSEIEALRLFRGSGAVMLLEAEAEGGALLLERALPGTPLSAIQDDDRATTAAAQVMRLLWRTAPESHQLRSVAGWAAGFDRLRRRYTGGTGPLPEDLVSAAERIFREFTSSPTRLVVLHGDLHHDNMLAAARAPWLAIDPKGVVGEPEYEVGAILRNPILGILRSPNPKRLLARRLGLLSDILGFDAQRLLGWAVGQAVLSAWWSIEDNETGWERRIECARLLSGIRL